MCRALALVTADGARPRATAAQTALATLCACAVFAAAFIAGSAVTDGRKSVFASLPAADALAFGYLALSAAHSLAGIGGVVLYANTERSGSRTWLLALVCAAALYAACKGLESVARASFLALCALAAVSSLALLFNAGNYDGDNMRHTAALFDSAWVNCFLSILLCPELALIFALRGRVAGGDKTGVRRYLPLFFVAQAALFALFALAEEAAFGGLRGLLDYPLLTLAAVAEASVISQLDTLLLGLWAAVSALRTAAFALGALQLVGGERASLKKSAGAVWAIYLASLALAAEGAQNAFRLYRIAGAATAAVVVFAIVFMSVAAIKRERNETP